MVWGKNASAVETRYVYGDKGLPLFELNFYDQGEQYPINEIVETSGYSTWQLSDVQKDAVVQSVALWAEIVSPGSQAPAPITISVATFDDENAAAIDRTDPNAGSIVGTNTQQSIVNGTQSGEPSLVLIGTLDFGTDDHPSLISTTSKVNLTATIYHEIAHSLGIGSLAELGKQTTQVCVWDTHLKDQNGNYLKPGITVVSADDAGLPSTPSDNVFVVGNEINSGVTFHGTHVSEVLGHDEGLVIEGIEGDSVDLSHIELERGLMSHQNYRNYSTFMEAELAVLQDIGYKIDRRNFFGYSVYSDNETIVNTNGYFARNDAGNGYVVGQANQTTCGIGLHVYGKRNQIVQAADLLAGGLAGTGIRIDGSGNSLSINPDVLVSADGSWGTGLFVSYGKDHDIVSRGDIRALGYGGVAARFDFGHNLLGDEFEYRGSWIWNVDNLPVSIPTQDRPNEDGNGFELNLDGALVKNFDVSGRLEGTAAAVYISENAWVQNINILSGASVAGDIVSNWDPENEKIQYEGTDRLNTNLTFGYAPSADGTSSGIPDDSFDMTLHGSVSGSASIDMKLVSGHLAVTDPISVYSLTNNGHLTLLGSGFDGSAAQVTTSFVNTSEATLETGFYADGSITGIQADSAALAGHWLIRPLRDFYSGRDLISVSAPVQTDNVTGTFETIELAQASSPTLNFTLACESPDETQVIVSRGSDAYSRYAQTPTAAAVGNVFGTIAELAQGDMQELFSALDWSDQSGTEIGAALNQLGTEAYDVSARASLSQHSELNTLLQRRMLALKDSRQPLARDSESHGTNHWQAWATPVGVKAKQNQHQGQASWKSYATGLVGGIERQFDEGRYLGLHAAVLSRRTDTDRAYDAHSETVSGFVGVHGALAPGDWNGFYLTAQGRIGLEDAELSRNISVNGYVRRTDGSWTGLSGSFSAGLGKDWTFALGNSRLSLGPVGWIEYSFLRRPHVSETGGEAADLKVASRTYDTLTLSLGARASMQAYRDNGRATDIDLLAAWRHDLLDGTFRTAAAFRDCDNYGFSSSTDLPGRDALLLQTSLCLTQSDRFRIQLEGGGEFFRKDAVSANVGLTFGWKF